jgi:hypothetical protein
MQRGLRLKGLAAGLRAAGVRADDGEPFEARGGLLEASSRWPARGSVPLALAGGGDRTIRVGWR